MNKMELLESMQVGRQFQNNIKLALGTGRLSFSEKFADDNVLDNKDVQLAAVYYNGLELEHICSRPLEIIKVALLREPQAKKFLTTAQRAQFEEYMLPNSYENSDNVLDAIEIVRENGLKIKDLAEDMRANEAVQKAAIFNNAFAFNYVINPTSEVVKLAWIKNKGVMGLASEIKPGIIPENVFLKSIEDPLALKIYMQSTQMSESFNLTSELVKNDPNIVCELLSTAWHGPSILSFSGSDVKKNRSLVAYAVFNDHTAAQFAHPDLLADREYIMQLVQINGLCLGYLPFEYRRDDEVVRLAKESYSEAVRFSLLPQDLEFVMLCGTSDVKSDKYSRVRYRSDSFFEEEYAEVIAPKSLPSSSGMINYGIFADDAPSPGFQQSGLYMGGIDLPIETGAFPDFDGIVPNLTTNFNVASDCLLPPKLQRHGLHIDFFADIEMFGNSFSDEKNINTDGFQQYKN